MKPDHELDAEQEADRLFFAANPGRRLYVRPARCGFERRGGDATVVVQVAEGLRLRLPFTVNPLLCLKALNEDEDELAAMVAASPMGPVVRAALGAG